MHATDLRDLRLACSCADTACAAVLSCMTNYNCVDLDAANGEDEEEPETDCSAELSACVADADCGATSLHSGNDIVGGGMCADDAGWEEKIKNIRKMKKRIMGCIGRMYMLAQ